MTYLLFLVLLCSSAKADVFAMTHFIPNKSLGFCFEPEIVISAPGSKSSGFGGNIKGIYGFSDLTNIIATLGDGAGPKKFRWNLTYTLDFFPDWKNQPGFGVGLGIGTTKWKKMITWQTLATFYTHKTLSIGKEKIYIIEPFVAVPVGLGLNNGSYWYLSSLVIGSFLHYSEKLSAAIEWGINLNNMPSYLSAGVTYYY
jgi:hypothetical protein